MTHIYIRSPISWVSHRAPFLPLGIDHTWMFAIYVSVALIGVGIAAGGTFLSLRKHLDV